MSYTIRGYSLKTINMKPATTAEEVLQNVAVILSTMKGEVPMDRGLGLSTEFIDKPINAARALFVSAVVDAVSTYEPRAQVDAVTFEIDEAVPGKLIPIVEVSISE